MDFQQTLIITCIMVKIIIFMEMLDTLIKQEIIHIVVPSMEVLMKINKMDPQPHPIDIEIVVKAMLMQTLTKILQANTQVNHKAKTNTI